MPESVEIAHFYLVRISFVMAEVLNAKFFGAAVMVAVHKILHHVHPELFKKKRQSVERSVFMLIVGTGLHNRPKE